MLLLTKAFIHQTTMDPEVEYWDHAHHADRKIRKALADSIVEAVRAEAGKPISISPRSIVIHTDHPQRDERPGHFTHGPKRYTAYFCPDSQNMGVRLWQGPADGMDWIVPNDRSGDPPWPADGIGLNLHHNSGEKHRRYLYRRTGIDVETGLWVYKYDEETKPLQA